MNDNTSCGWRYQTSTPELDAAELAWWEKFSEIEDRFCWVQTRTIQQMVRGHYVRRILRASGGSDQIVELGCGAGWLSILMGQLGGNNVLGLDFSAKQIQLARERAQWAGVAGSVRFEQVDRDWYAKTDLRTNVVVMHAFLHHLATKEIQEVLSFASKILLPGGKVFVVEPILYRGGDAEESKKLKCRFDYLMNIPKRGQRRGLRQFSEEERRTRALIGERCVGVGPMGPSPKETAFAVQELVHMLEQQFVLEHRERVLGIPHIVAQELLLAELSNPLLAKLMRWPLLLLAQRLDRRILALKSPPEWLWIFELFECRK